MILRPLPAPLCFKRSIYCHHSGDARSPASINNNNNNNNNNNIQRRCSRLFTISSQRRELSPTRTLKWPRRNRVQITWNKSSAYHVQHVVLRATWYEGTAQLLSLTELKSHLFELYFVGWNIKPMKEGRKPEYPEKSPGDELQKFRVGYVFNSVALVLCQRIVKAEGRSENLFTNWN